MSEPFIAKETNYFNEKGQHIIALEAVSGAIPGGLPHYFAHIRTPVGRNGDEEMYAEARVPIPGESVAEAFAALDDAVTKAVKEMKDNGRKQMMTPRLVVPGGAA